MILRNQRGELSPSDRNCQQDVFYLTARWRTTSAMAIETQLPTTSTCGAEIANASEFIERLADGYETSSGDAESN